jgi:hypothetical protein
MKQVSNAEQARRMEGKRVHKYGWWNSDKYGWWNSEDKNLGIDEKVMTNLITELANKYYIVAG